MEKLDDITIVKFDGVTQSAVYFGFVTNLLNITEKLKWRKAGAIEYGYDAEVLTLEEIYKQVRDLFNGHAIITVFVSDPLHGYIYQCGNYRDGHWMKYGTTIGYA